MSNQADSVSMWIVIPQTDTDSAVLENTIESLVQTATALPNTKSQMDEDNTRILTVYTADAVTWPEITDQVNELCYQYERLVAQRDELGIDLDEYYEIDAEWRDVDGES